MSTANERLPKLEEDDGLEGCKTSRRKCACRKNVEGIVTFQSSSTSKIGTKDSHLGKRREPIHLPIAQEFQHSTPIIEVRNNKHEVYDE